MISKHLFTVAFLFSLVATQPVAPMNCPTSKKPHAKRVRFKAQKPPVLSPAMISFESFRISEIKRATDRIDTLISLNPRENKHLELPLLKEIRQLLAILEINDLDTPLVKGFITDRGTQKLKEQAKFLYTVICCSRSQRGLVVPE